MRFVEPMDFASSFEPKEDDSSISGVNFSAFMKEGGIKVKIYIDVLVIKSMMKYIIYIE